METSPRQTHSLLQGSWKYAVLLASFFSMLIGGAYFLAKYVDAPVHTFGILPRSFSGLTGVVLAPFIHADLSHLMSNLLSLWVLVIFLFIYFPKRFWQLVFFFWLLTGVYTWCLGRPAYHIGASGQVYAIVLFILSFGILRRKPQYIAMSLLIVFLYGGFIWGLLPLVSWMSWEAHLSGALTGIIAAVYLRNEYKFEEMYEYDWQRPDYIETSELEQEDVLNAEQEKSNKVVYHFRPKEEKESSS